MVYVSVLDKARVLKLFHELDKTPTFFSSNFELNSSDSFKIIATYQKKYFSCTLKWFFDHIFETRKKIHILFLSRERIAKGL